MMGGYENQQLVLHCNHLGEGIGDFGGKIQQAVSAMKRLMAGAGRDILIESSDDLLVCWAQGETKRNK